jgi:hypothetical protein
LPQTIEERAKIANCGKQSISGKVASNYFKFVCDYIFENKKDMPIAP